MSQHRHGRSRPVASLLTLTLTSGTLASLGVFAAAPAGATPTPTCNQPTVSYAAGASGSYTVPAGATTVDVTASGAAAVASNYPGQGGSGATVTTTLTVTPGEVLDFSVGTRGSIANAGLSGSSPSGGSAIAFTDGRIYGSGGAGATFVSTAGSVLVAAGGGGGAGYYGANGGNAGPGTLTSTSGVFTGGNGGANGGSPATGGSSTVGTGGQSTGGYYGAGDGNPGSGQLGGNAGSGSGAGGGGGGYQGGGGGGLYSAPGAGGAGSSYAVSDYTIVANGSAGSLILSAPADPVFQSADNTTFIEGQNSPFTVCAPGGPGTTVSYTGSLPAGVTFTDNGNGTATLAGAATEAGTFPLTLTSTSSVGTEGQDFSLVVNDISAKTLVVSVDPASITAGGQVTGTVTAYDAQHDVATTDQDLVSLSSSDLQSSPPQVNLTDGTGTFTVNLYTAGAQTVTATDDALEGQISGTSNDVDVAPAAATSLTVEVPATATAGVSVPAVITAHDDWGNTDTNDNDTVNLTSSDTDGTLQATATLVAGTVTVPVTFVNAGNEFMTATDATDASITDQSDDVVVDPAATTRLDMGMPYVVVAGSTNVANVQTLDAYGNATTTTDVVHFTSSDPQAVLPADAGMDTLSGSVPVTLKTAGAQTVTVTDVTNPDVASSTWDVTVIPGAVQAVHTHAGDQQSVAAAHDFGSPLSALVVDANGNPVPSQQVVFSVLNGADSSFNGSDTDAVWTDQNGLATSAALTAGTTPGTVTITAATNGQNQLLVSGRRPVVNGSTSFTETITASDAAVAATPKTSTGVGTATQSAQVTLPTGGSVALLNANGDPVTMVVTADGTYVLDPATGVITFVAVAGFTGAATPVTYQVTDAYHLQATSTYTPTVTAPAPVVPPTNPVSPPPPVTPPVSHPLGVAHVRTASHVVLTGSTLPATCTVSVAALGTCRTALTATVAGRQLVLGKSSTVKAHAGSKQVKTVIQLNALGRAMAAQVGGVKASVWAAVTKTDGRALSAKRPVSLVDQHVLVPAPVLFPTASTQLSAEAQRQLKSLKSHLAGVRTVTCIGYTDSVGNAATNLALGKARAKAVCAALAGHGVKLVLVTRGDKHPAGDNATPAGRALNRRVELRLTY